ncbi:hypothetical protein [Lysobacter sp. GX 14042]|uniref:hypothetical protein n=1 Tax=Lysobacter sp. GX 14042 TaxID=2907155 RepID=UPI00272E372F|nr:hypothetical protein [Lysobacter sp. GX 14042]
MSTHRTVLATAVLAFAVVSAPAQAQSNDDRLADLRAQLVRLEADPELGSLAAYERLQASQAIDAAAQARSSTFAGARYVAERRVQIAQVVARTAAMEREADRLDRERSELIVEASRRDAAAARAEAERLRIEAQIQAEEAARLRARTMTDAEMMADVEKALEGVADTQAAQLRAARQREAELRRMEEELMRDADD